MISKKKEIKYSPNLDAIVINSKRFRENHTLEGIAIKHERIINDILSNPQKYRK